MLAATQPSPSTVATDETAVIAQQQILIATQAQMVRDLEAALGLAPPPPVPPAVPPPPVAGTDLDSIFAIQTAAIRVQAAYIRHLEDLQVALTPGP